MEHKFAVQKRWKKQGYYSLFYVSIIIPSLFLLFIDIDKEYTLAQSIIILLAFTVFILTGIIRSLYYFNLPKWNYVVLTKNAIVLHRINPFSDKRIDYGKVERVGEVKDVLVFRLVNGKEVTVYMSWLSADNAVSLKNELKRKFNRTGFVQGER